MKTSVVRIVIGILAVAGASQVFSQTSSKMYLRLEDAAGVPKIVSVADDGTFTSPPLTKGSYTIILCIKKDAVQTVSESSGPGTRFTIHFDKAVTQPREISDVRGKHFPRLHRITAFIGDKDVYHPIVIRKLSIIAIEEDSVPLTGKIEITTNGTTETPGDWLLQK